ncbi:MAG: outer membrane beta-barrel protein [Pseudomonadota bacterium]
MGVKMQFGRTNILSAVVGLGLSLAAFPAMASNESGVYVSAFAGVGFQQDLEGETTIATAGPLSVDIDLDTGFVVGGAIGYAFPSLRVIQLRVEAELSYRENDAGSALLDGIPQLATLDTSSLAGIANVLIDFEIFPIVTPFIGAGVGIAGVESDVELTSDLGDLLQFGGPTQTELVYQFIAGFSIPLPGSLEIYADGRYYRAADPDFTLSDPLGALPTSVFDNEFEIIHVTAGLRYTF